MRKYQGILFAALFCFAMLLLLAAGLWWYRPRRAEPVPGRVYESERMPENNAVLNPGTGSGGETIRLLSDGGGWDAAYL